MNMTVTFLLNLSVTFVLNMTVTFILNLSVTFILNKMVTFNLFLAVKVAWTCTGSSSCRMSTSWPRRS